MRADVRALIDTFRFAILATIRRDGSPRISTVETHFVGDDLMIVMIPRTRKAADVRRDNRVVLQSPITSAGDPGPEFKLRGYARVVKDDERLTATTEAVASYSGWTPEPTWLFVAVMLTDVTHIFWTADGSATLSRWTGEGGLGERVHLRLDMGLGRYTSDD